MASVKMSTMPLGYDGQPQRAEVMGYSEVVHGNEQGVYIQFVEGCGYHVWNLTPAEAEKLGLALIAEANEQRKRPAVPAAA
jgi:hypothetical protein